MFAVFTQKNDYKTHKFMFFVCFYNHLLVANNINATNGEKTAKNKFLSKINPYILIPALFDEIANNTPCTCVYIRMSLVLIFVLNPQKNGKKTKHTHTHTFYKKTHKYNTQTNLRC